MQIEVPQNSPKRSYEAHRSEIDAVVARVLQSGWYILGKEVTAFEQEFAAFLGARHAVGLASGTDAIALALRACGVGEGDAVLTVSHTAVATVAAIELAGATAVLVDIDPRTYNLDANKLAEGIRAAGKKNRLKAVVAVHLYGHPADMPAIMSLARKHELSVIEDCAQAHGATIAGKLTGTLGDAAAFSFYPTKNLAAFGDGGAVVTNDGQIAENVRLLREYGWRERYVSERAGTNSRLDELQAAILRVKLQSLAAENRRRSEAAATYDRLLPNASVKLPQRDEKVDHAFHQYVVRSAQRDRLRKYLSESGIGTLIHYPMPVHLQPAYRGRVVHDQLPESEEASREVLSLPMHAQIRDDEIARVAEAIMSWGR